VLDLAREDTSLNGQDARDPIAIGVRSFDDDLPIEREGDERGGVRGDGLGESLADEPTFAENRHRSALERRVGGF